MFSWQASRCAPNGVEYNPLFALDLNFNLWLWQAQGLYAFSDSHFWGQKAAPDVTNPSQGAFDFSKREYDINAGLAWNYAGPLEARLFAYSYNNLNRGNSTTVPIGYEDGVGFENRWYINEVYDRLGQPGFDVARASFLSAGYYPTKDMIDAAGHSFKPGLFLHANLAWPPVDSDWYIYTDAEAIAKQSGDPKLVTVDGGIAVRPFPRAPFVEFRLGTDLMYDLELHEAELNYYTGVQVIF